jgi:hypothetical protein
MKRGRRCGGGGMACKPSEKLPYRSTDCISVVNCPEVAGRHEAGLALPGKGCLGVRAHKGVGCQKGAVKRDARPRRRREGSPDLGKRWIRARHHGPRYGDAGDGIACGLDRPLEVRNETSILGAGGGACSAALWEARGLTGGGLHSRRPPIYSKRNTQGAFWVVPAAVLQRESPAKSQLTWGRGLCSFPPWSKGRKRLKLLASPFGPVQGRVGGGGLLSFFAARTGIGEDLGSEAHVAQSVERVLGKDEVTSSILVMGSSFRRNQR